MGGRTGGKGKVGGEKGRGPITKARGGNKEKRGREGRG